MNRSPVDQAERFYEPAPARAWRANSLRDDARAAWGRTIMQSLAVKTL